MLRTKVRVAFAALIMTTGMYFTACKSKPKNTETQTENTRVETPQAAPVEVANDNALIAGVRDATKDHPGVKADVNNGEITLTGNIERSKLPNLMMSLNSLKPKKITNQLTIK